MLRSLALAACFGGAAALSMEQALYPGRVGDVVFTTEVKSSHLVFVGAGKSAGPASMLETSVAPLAAHIAGAMPTAFPGAMPEVARHVCAPASALLMLAVEGITMPELDEFPRIAKVVAAGHAVRLEHAFEPRDRVSAAVSRATGTTPADHGVASKAWIDGKTSELVAAFSSGRADSASRVAGISDVVGQTSEGQALILSVSSDAQLAAAAGAHPTLARTSAASWPAAVVSYDSEARALKPTQLGEALREELFTVSLAEAELKLRALAPAELAAMDLTKPLVAALVAELGGFVVILERLKSDSLLAALLADRQTDLLTLSLAAFAPLKTCAKARALVDAAVPLVLAAFAQTWGAAARAQLVLAPADADVAVAEVEGWTVVGAHAFAKRRASDEAKLEGCAKFAAATAGQGLTAHCLVGTQREGGRRLAAEPFEMPSTTYTSDQLELFQVTLWSSILLLVALLAGSCALYNMEVTQDSLLFSKGKDA